MQKVRANSRGRKYINGIKINVNSTIQHELGKFKECWDLAKQGIDFATEVIFENGQRADILVLDPENIHVVEILCSETQERFDAKNYPFKIIAKRIKTK
jgi:hypothetical protein